MAELLMLNEPRVESILGSSSSSSRVTPEPLHDDEHQVLQVIISSSSSTSASEISLTNYLQQDTTSTLIGSGERSHNPAPAPEDAWLPITESRNGNTWTATFHLLSSGIGFQTLLLPLAFISLGSWVWGIICLSVAFCWQLYTIWLLVNLHEESTTTGTPNIIRIRYSRYLQLSMLAFGEKVGKLVAIFPTMYLSGGACTLYIIAGGTNLELLYQHMISGSHDDHNNPISGTGGGALWFLIFICLAVFTAHFFPNLHSLAPISFIGSITALAYCTTIICLLSIFSHHEDDMVEADNNNNNSGGFRNVVNGIGYIALAFKGHNLVLEIQGTIVSNWKKPSRKSMWRGVTISYSLIAMCMYPLAIVGYWAYENNKVTAANANGGGIIPSAFTKNHDTSKSKYTVGAVYITIIINYICAFQIYAMPTFDNLQRIYTTRKNKACPKWVRSGIKVLFGGLTYLIAVAFPFLASLSLFIGSITLPLTLAYPCLMWVAIKKPGRFSRICNLGLGYLGIVLSILSASAGLWSLILNNGLDANFFKP